MWIKCKAEFIESDEPDYEELGINKDPAKDWGKFLFNTDHLEAVNELENRSGCCTLRFESGLTIIVDVDLKEIENMMKTSYEIYERGEIKV